MIKYKFNILKEILIVFRSSGVYLKEGIFLLIFFFFNIFECIVYVYVKFLWNVILLFKYWYMCLIIL